jgi:hypothetical protein
VRLYARIALLLGGFLTAAGLVYGVTASEWRGFVLLLVAGGGFAYLGLYARRAVRIADRAEREAGSAPGILPPAGSEELAAQPSAASPPLEEVRPTIWPLVFSLAGAGIVAGILANHWLLLLGGVLAVAAAAGWFLEVLAQQQGHGHH